jgi:RHS repeat-associated protein
MQLSAPDPLGIPRNVAWVPTDDPSKRHLVGIDATQFAGGRWAPKGLSALGHQLTIDIASGALTITATDLQMPYHALGLAVTRTFDAQEQYAQQSYLDSHPNTDPRIHLFANWQHSREAAISEVWLSTLPELLATDGRDGGALYYRAYPDFAVNTVQQADVEGRLSAYGVPQRTLAALGWKYSQFDSVLRTRQGSFSLLAGSFRAETLVDAAEVRLYGFDVTTGTAYRYSSEYSYQQFIDDDGSRETTVSALVVNAVDGLGHHVSFTPVESQPPYRSYRLTDGIGRSIRFDLTDHVEYLDGDRYHGTAKTYVITSAIDETRTTNNVIQYAYEDGRLMQASYPGHAGGARRLYRYDYDEEGRLVKITDPVGDFFTLEYLEDRYDTDERLMARLKLARLADAEGNEVRYQYDNAERTVTVTYSGAAGDTRSVIYTYTEDTTDTRQRYITSERIPVSLGVSGLQDVETRWQYSADGHFVVTSVADALGATTAFSYNDFNQVTSREDAAGHARNFEYDNRTAPTSNEPHRYDVIGVSETNVDADGNSFPVASEATYVRYDSSTSDNSADTVQSTHRIGTRTNELGVTSQFEYDETGGFLPLRPTRYVDPLGNASTRDYDATGLPIREADAEGNTREMSYSAQGLQLTQRDPNGNVHSWVYDPGSLWMTDFTDALGSSPGDPAHSIHYERTDAGQPSRRTDPLGATFEYSYYANKRLKSVTQRDPLPRTLTFAYTASGVLTGIQDAAVHTTFFGVDEAGRIYSTYRDDPANPAITASFDAAGRPVEITDRNGQKTSLQYDALGRVVAIQEPDWPAEAATNPGKQVSIQYDKLGRRLVVTDTELPRASRYTYDAAGRLTQAVEPFGPILTKTYDARDTLIQVQSGDGVVQLQFGRDRAGRLTSVVDAGWQDASRTFEFSYNDGIRIDNLYGINGPWELSTRFAYDANRRITSTANEQSGTPQASYSYTYRADSLIGSVNGDHTGTYDYDGIKRLIQETDAGVKSGYDASGNRLWRAATEPTAADVNSYDADNRLIQSPADDKTYVYDDNGNLLLIQPAAGAATHYVYDGANRLRGMERGELSIQYLYDVGGRVLERRRTVNNSAHTERYWYSAGALLAVLDSAGDPQTVYTRADAGRVLRRRSKTPLNPQPANDQYSLYYLLDGLQNVVRLVDADGHVHVTADYDAWGNGAVPNVLGGERFSYRGAFTDPDSELLLFGRRWYVPALGRWLTQDPLLADALRGRLDVTTAVMDVGNLYVYVGDNPLNLIDPTGLGAWDWIKARAREILIAGMKGRDQPRAVEMQTKPPLVENVKKQSPDNNADEAGDGDGIPDGEETFDPAEAGYDDPGYPEEDSDSSLKRDVAKGTAAAGTAVGVGVVVWEVVKDFGWVLAL